VADGIDFGDGAVCARSRFLCRVGKHVHRFTDCTRTGCRLQGHNLLIGCCLELYYVVHIVGSQNVFHRQFFSIGSHDYGTFGSFKQGIVGYGRTVFINVESVSGIENLIPLIVRDDREHSFSGFAGPFGKFLSHSGLKSHPTACQHEGNFSYFHGSMYVLLFYCFILLRILFVSQLHR